LKKLLAFSISHLSAFSEASPANRPSEARAGGESWLTAWVASAALSWIRKLAPAGHAEVALAAATAEYREG
jgi:hypothetical protein